MEDAAIDFRKLLREEKKKAREKQRQQQKQQQDAATATSSCSIAQEPSKAQQQQCDLLVVEEKKESGPGWLLSKQDAKYVVREDDIEAIDFDRLVQDEKQERRTTQQQQEQREQERALADSWTIPATGLLFDRDNNNNNKHLVCSNPPSIYYIPEFMPLEQDQQSLMGWLQSLPENPKTSQDLRRPNKDDNKDDDANGKWTVMHYAKRRVAMFDATTTTTTTVAAAAANDGSGSTTCFPWPLQRIVNALVTQGIFSPQQPPNHILVNEYHAGQGILPHTDGPAYLSRTATLSLGSDVLIDFTPRPNYHHPIDPNSNNSQEEEEERRSTTVTTTASPEPQLWLQKGSLVVFEDKAYLDYCHGIQDRILEEQVTHKCMNIPVVVVAENDGSGEKDNGGGMLTIQRGYRISLTFRHKYHPDGGQS